MKNIKFLLFLFFFPFFCFSQELTGIWSGSLSNDSSTVRKNQSFEIAISEYKGKVYGYTYSTFIVNDTLYYIIKRVKGDINGKICEVKDDEVVTHNFQRAPAKGVNVVYTFRQNQKENTWTIDGNWKTTATKEYYSVTGDIIAKAEKDISRSKLYQHLGDLNLQNTLVLDKQLDKKPAREDVAKTKIKSEKENPERDIVKQKEDHSTISNQKESIDKKATTTIVKSEKKKQTDNVVYGDVSNKEQSSPAIVINKSGSAESKTNESNNKEGKLIIKQQNNTVKTDVKKPEIKADQKLQEKDVIAANSKPDLEKPGIQKNIIADEIKQSGIKQNESIVKTEARNPETKKSETAVDQKLQEKNAIAVNSKPDLEKPGTQKNVIADEIKQSEVKQNESIVKTEARDPDAKKPETEGDQKLQEKKTIAANSKSELEKPGTQKNIIADEIKQSEVKQNESRTKTEIPAELKNPSTDFVFTDLKRSDRKIKPATAMVEERASIPSETIYFKSDSLVLALYDNGEIDGDTVSVILNGELIIEKQGLKSAAFKKTIYLTPDDGDSVLLVLYAENLGLYPPNTGLLIVKDGDESYYVRFNADFDRNAAILLRRKLK